MKVSAPCLRIVILGAPHVGKSAVTVRFLTRRFIGEYSSGTDCTYQTMFQYEDAAVKVEIMDCALPWEISRRQIMEADAFVLVYSITDSGSLKQAHAILATLTAMPNLTVPILLLGNKTDLQHLRQVSRHDVSRLTHQYQCRHCEISAAESYAAVDLPMQEVLREGLENKRWRLSQVKRRRGLLENVSKRLGSVFRRKSMEGIPQKRKLARVAENPNRRSV